MFEDINCLNGGCIMVKPYDDKKTYVPNKDASLNIIGFDNRFNSVVLKKSEMIALVAILNERLTHYPVYNFTAKMFELTFQRLNKLFKENVKMINYKTNMALAYNYRSKYGFLLIADSDIHASAYHFSGELNKVSDEDTSDFEFAEIKGLDIRNFRIYDVTFIGDELYFGR